jgi:hypothetical protein
MNRIELASKMRAVASQILRDKGYVSPVDVLLAMDRLSKENHERWRFRQTPFLEKILPGSLDKHEFFLRELRAFAGELNLKPSRTAYVSWGKGRKEPLRFTKTGNPRLEELYATHYVSPQLSKPKPAPQAADDSIEH